MCLNPVFFVHVNESLLEIYYEHNATSIQVHSYELNEYYMNTHYGLAIHIIDYYYCRTTDDV